MELQEAAQIHQGLQPANIGRNASLHDMRAIVKVSGVAGCVLAFRDPLDIAKCAASKTSHTVSKTNVE